MFCPVTENKIYALQSPQLLREGNGGEIGEKVSGKEEGPGLVCFSRAPHHIQHFP